MATWEDMTTIINITHYPGNEEFVVHQIETYSVQRMLIDHL